MTAFATAAAFCTALAAVPALALPAGTQNPPQTPPAQATPATPASAPAFPEGAKVAFIQGQRILELSVEGKSAQAKIEAFRQKKLDEIAEKNKALEAAQQKLSQGASAEAKLAAQREIDRLQVEIQRLQQDAQRELDEYRQELNREFEKKLSPIVQQIINEKGLLILFGSEAAGLIWADPAVDLTMEVVKRFDAAVIAKPPAPPKAPRP
jgi:outer membrane protein